MEPIKEEAPIVEIELGKVGSQSVLSSSIASTVSEPVRSPPGPYWQMVYYAVSGFFFWYVSIHSFFSIS